VTAKELGVKPQECVVVEDLGVGLLSAKAADMICIVRPTKYTQNDDFLIADKVIANAKEIEKYLKSF